MEATITEPVPTPERTVTLTMTESEAVILCLYLGKHSYARCDEWLDSVAYYPSQSRPSAQELYDLTATAYFALADVCEFG